MKWKVVFGSQPKEGRVVLLPAPLGPQALHESKQSELFIHIRGKKWDHGLCHCYPNEVLAVSEKMWASLLVSARVFVENLRASSKSWRQGQFRGGGTQTLYPRLVTRIP